MSIFDAIFGTKTTKALDQATATQNANLYNQQQNNAVYLNKAASDASGALNTGVSNGLSSLLSGYTGANDALTSYGGQAQGALSNGVGQAVGTVQGSNGAFQPYVDAGAKAGALYGDSLGLNGAAGNDAATAAFRASPGYRFQVDEATDAASRKAASLGMAASGNTLDAITRLGSNLADQQWGGWQDRLNGVSGQGLTAANAVAGNNAVAGGFQMQGGTGLATLLDRLGTGVSGNDAALGTGQAGLQSALGSGLSSIATNLGANQVNNAWHGVDAVAQNALGDASAKDAATNSNNGIFSKLIFGGLGDALTGTASGKALSSMFAKL